MKYFYLLLMIVLPEVAAAAPGQSSQWTDLFYDSGKIYVVTGALLLILAGIIFYLVRLERKIRRMEKEMEDHQR